MGSEPKINFIKQPSKDAIHSAAFFLPLAMHHFLFKREEKEYKFVKIVNNDIKSQDYDYRTSMRDGIRYDDDMGTAVVVANGLREAISLINDSAAKK